MLIRWQTEQETFDVMFKHRNTDCDVDVNNCNRKGEENHCESRTMRYESVSPLSGSNLEADTGVIQDGIIITT
jgi:hypothetical protein